MTPAPIQNRAIGLHGVSLPAAPWQNPMRRIIQGERSVISTRAKVYRACLLGMDATPRTTAEIAKLIGRDRDNVAGAISGLRKLQIVEGMGERPERWRLTPLGLAERAIWAAKSQERPQAGQVGASGREMPPETQEGPSAGKNRGCGE